MAPCLQLVQHLLHNVCNCLQAAPIHFIHIRNAFQQLGFVETNDTKCVTVIPARIVLEKASWSVLHIGMRPHITFLCILYSRVDLGHALADHISVDDILSSAYAALMGMFISLARRTATGICVMHGIALSIKQAYLLRAGCIGTDLQTCY